MISGAELFAHLAQKGYDYHETVSILEKAEKIAEKEGTRIISLEHLNQVLAEMPERKIESKGIPREQMPVWNYLLQSNLDADSMFHTLAEADKEAAEEGSDFITTVHVAKVIGRKRGYNAARWQ
jgi:hypothetical protein